VTRFLFLVRHGEAPGDGDLSAAGREQARLTGERLQDVPFGGICHGPLPRAAQTAELIISVITYQADLPASLLTFNDAGHLSPELRWTGFPPTLRFLPPLMCQLGGFPG
jgi:broad specificity phosphatase PhoE